MKALDIVRTPKGSIGFITETNEEGNSASIDFIGDLKDSADRNSWWSSGELEVIDSIPRLLAEATAHPFGRGREDVKYFFGENKKKERN